MYKTENEIWADIIGIMNTACTAKNIEGFTVMQGNQPTNITVQDSAILLNRIYSRRYGWQGRKDKIVDGVMTHIESYFQTLSFQVTILKKRDVTNTAEVTASDIANYLVDYLQSNAGLKELRALGYMPIKITEVREPAFVNDNDVFEKSPSFDIVLDLLQTIDSEQEAIESYEVKTYGV